MLCSSPILKADLGCSLQQQPWVQQPLPYCRNCPKDSALSSMPPVPGSALQLGDTWAQLHRGAQKMKSHSVPEDSETPKWPSETCVLLFISHESQQTPCPNLVLEVIGTYKIAIYNGISSFKRKKERKRKYNKKHQKTKYPQFQLLSCSHAFFTC